MITFITYLTIKFNIIMLYIWISKPFAAKFLLTCLLDFYYFFSFPSYISSIVPNNNLGGRWFVVKFN